MRLGSRISGLEFLGEVGFRVSDESASGSKLDFELWAVEVYDSGLEGGRWRVEGGGRRGGVKDYLVLAPSCPSSAEAN